MQCFESPLNSEKYYPEKPSIKKNYAEKQNYFKKTIKEKLRRKTEIITSKNRSKNKLLRKNVCLFFIQVNAIRFRNTALHVYNDEL